MIIFHCAEKNLQITGGDTLSALKIYDFFNYSNGDTYSYTKQFEELCSKETDRFGIVAKMLKDIGDKLSQLNALDREPNQVAAESQNINGQKESN